MLEPLIVLTVLNCFFMLSSTVTTCALWWQYRSHRCCFKKCPPQQSSRNDLKKSNSCRCQSLRHPTKSKLHGILNIVNTNKSSTTVDRQAKANKENKEKGKKAKNRKSKTNLKYLSQYSKEKENVDRLPIDLIERSTMSEASQTNHENKPTMVMEYSTVQKIVQVVDDETKLSVTTGPFKSLKDLTLDKKKNVNFRGEEGSENLSVLTQS